MEKYHLSTFTVFWKESINQLSNRSGSAAKISQVLCSSHNVHICGLTMIQEILTLYPDGSEISAFDPPHGQMND